MEITSTCAMSFETPFTTSPMTPWFVRTAASAAGMPTHADAVAPRSRGDVCPQATSEPAGTRGNTQIVRQHLTGVAAFTGDVRPVQAPPGSQVTRYTG